MIADVGEFIDTNVVVYSIAQGQKADICRALMRARKCQISVQVLNEFAYVARRKMAMSWSEIERALLSIETVCETVYSVDLATHRDGIRLAKRYNFSVFDAMIVATALRAGATILHSEDMQHGLLVDNQLRISNPFIAGQSPSSTF